MPICYLSVQNLFLQPWRNSMKRKRLRTLLSIGALGVFALSSAHAQDQKNVAWVEYVLASNHPAMPVGLQLVCMPVSGSGAPDSPTCPVVRYQGITTWAYSFADNRTALALVSYDAHNNIVRNVQKNGARYLFNATSSEPNKTVTFVGQGDQWLTVPWSELGAVQK
jgi:hypothetical protein